MAQKEFRKQPRYMVGDIVYSHGFICVVCSVYPFRWLMGEWMGRI